MLPKGYPAPPFFILFLLTLIAQACDANRTQYEEHGDDDSIADSKQDSVKSQAETRSTISPEIFESLPPALQHSPRCFFARSQEALRNRLYIYADNKRDKGFFYRNNRFVALNMLPADPEKENTESGFFITDYKNDTYQVRTRLQVIDFYEGGAGYKGNIEFKDVYGNSYKTAIYCDCSD